MRTICPHLFRSRLALVLALDVTDPFQPAPAGRLSVAVTTVALLVCAITLAANWPFNNRRQYFIARDYVENLLEHDRAQRLLLTLDWQCLSMFYAQG